MRNVYITNRRIVYNFCTQYYFPYKYDIFVICSFRQVCMSRHLCPINDIPCKHFWKWSFATHLQYPCTFQGQQMNLFPEEMENRQRLVLIGTQIHRFNSWSIHCQHCLSISGEWTFQVYSGSQSYKFRVFWIMFIILKIYCPKTSTPSVTYVLRKYQFGVFNRSLKKKCIYQLQLQLLMKGTTEFRLLLIRNSHVATN